MELDRLLQEYRSALSAWRLAQAEHRKALAKGIINHARDHAAALATAWATLDCEVLTAQEHCDEAHIAVEEAWWRLASYTVPLSVALKKAEQITTDFS